MRGDETFAAPADGSAHRSEANWASPILGPSVAMESSRALDLVELEARFKPDRTAKPVAR